MEGLKICMRYIFVLSLLILAGVFATDWWFTRDGDLLNDTLVGVMIGAPLGWFGSVISFYTTEKVSEMIKKEDTQDGSHPPPGPDN